MTQRLYRLGRWCVRRRRAVLGLWVAVAGLLIVLGQTAGGDLADAITVPEAESQEATDLLAERFPAASGDSAYVVVEAPEGETVRSPAVAAAITETAEAAQALDDVTVVSSPLAEQGARQVSADGRIAFLEVRYGVAASEVGESGVEALTEAAAPLRDAGYAGAVGGPVATASASPETGTAELVGLVAAVIILLLAFGSAIAMSLPILTAVLGILTGFGIVNLLANGIDVATIAPSLGTMIGLAVGIDYALFIITRQREHLAAGMTMEESIGRAVATAGNAVLFAGCTVVIAILGMWTTGVAFLGSIGTAAAVVVAVAVALALTLLPALLGFAGANIDRFSLPLPRRSHVATASDRWARWSLHVTDRPWRYLALSLAALLIVAIPFASIEVGFPDAGNDPPDSDTRVAYDLLAEGFGPGFNGPLLIAAELPAGPAAQPYLEQLNSAVAADPAVAAVSPAQPSPDGATAVLRVIPTSSPQSQTTTDLVERLRDEVLPPVDAAAGNGANALVGGFTAAQIDLSDRLVDTLPRFVTVVIALSFVLLAMVFRSVLVPLKAAVMNLLSIVAAYGVLVAVFQWGWGAELIGLEETVPIPPFLPVAMFAILFGLSMDYEVFLLSRIREDYLKLRDNSHSVATGLAGTAKVITSAAAIMIAVFLAFVGSEDTTLKMIGVGLATAVLVDATIVRLVLVPSTMALLGDANWWLPAWLDRLLPRIDLEGDAGLPAPQYADGSPAQRRRKRTAALLLAVAAQRVREADGDGGDSALVHAVARLDAGGPGGDPPEVRARRAAATVLEPLALAALADAGPEPAGNGTTAVSPSRRKADR